MRCDRPELLAPAGSPDALRAAVCAGADAVYLGGGGFNARAYATNFSPAAMEEAIAYCHLFGVRVYITLNTLLYDKEKEAFLDFARQIARMGADAAIVADLGAISLLRHYVPELPVHASTQASVHSTKGACAMAALGATRTVLARELSYADICSVTTHAPIETEIFLHGALCVSHSGQCLFSSLVGGRSGNRGACAQPCRLPYNGEGHPLSLRDLSLSAHIPELLRSGVASLKIEGRMKSAAYVDGVVSIYRRLLDEGRAATPKEEERLRALFSRTGFTDAYFRGAPREPMTGIRSPEDKAMTRETTAAPMQEKKLPLTAQVILRADEAAALTFFTPHGSRVTVTGAVPEPAQSSPLTREAVVRQITRLGGTPFSLRPEDVAVTCAPGLNLSPAALNDLRRRGTDALMHAAAGRLPVHPMPPPWTAPSPIAGQEEAPPLRRTVLCFSPAQADALQAYVPQAIDALFLPLFSYQEAHTCPQGVYLPPVVTDHEWPQVQEAMQQARRAGVRYALCGNIGLIAPARACGLTVIGDYRLNVTNRDSAALLHQMGVQQLILSPEMTLPQLRDMGEGSAITYGRIPLMLLERCFTRENGGCQQCGRAVLTDRRGARFPLIREYPHRNLLLNSLPTYMGDRQDALRHYAVQGEHLLFTIEDPALCPRILDAYLAGRPLDIPCRRIARQAVTPPASSERDPRAPRTPTQGAPTAHTPASGAPNKGRRAPAAGRRSPQTKGKHR